ncbi:MAG: hypothetical protein HRU38_25385 [Saccharospirillaceae bacterium]|nr:hypothetical protein [Saccharospirillaceae bacterium]
MAYYDSQPFFSPFNYFEKSDDYLPDADELSESIYLSNQILGSCKYYEMDAFINLPAFSISNNNFSLISLNIDGCRTNFDKFKLMHNSIRQAKINVSCYILCETNVSQEQSDPFYLNYYNKFVLDRTVNTKTNQYKHKGSGIIIFLDTIYKNATIDLSLSYTSPDCEFLVVKFFVNKETHIIVGVYRPPSGSVEKFVADFENMLNVISSNKNTTIHILGDFNLNLYNPASKYVNSYLDCVFSSSLFPVISRATHFMGRNPTCIDHILTNKIADTVTSGIILNNISHHMPVFTVLNINTSTKNATQAKTKVHISEHTILGFSNDIKSYINSVNDADLHNEQASTCFTNFFDNFKSYYDKWFIAPRIQKPNDNYIKKDWMTVGLAKSCRYKNKLHNVWCKYRTKQTWNSYITYKRKLDKLLKKAKFDFYHKEFSNCNSDIKKTWRTINDILGKKKINSVLTFTLTMPHIISINISHPL